MGNGTTMEVITCGMTTEHSLPYMVFFVSVLIDFARKKEHTLERGYVDCWAFLCIGTCGAEAKRVCGIAQPYNFSDGNPAWDAYAEPSASEAYLKPKKKPLYA